MMLSPEQKLADELADFVLAEKPAIPYILYNHRYLSLPLSLDYFNKSSCDQISRAKIEQLNPGDLIIWDNLYAEFESGIKKQTLDSLPQLKPLKIFETNENGKSVVFAVYYKN